MYSLSRTGLFGWRGELYRGEKRLVVPSGARPEGSGRQTVPMKTKDRRGTEITGFEVCQKFFYYSLLGSQKSLIW
jgi:hypothetical protein